MHFCHVGWCSISPKRLRCCTNTLAGHREPQASLGSGVTLCMAPRDFFRSPDLSFPICNMEGVSQRTKDPFVGQSPLWLILGKIRPSGWRCQGCRQGKSTSETDLLRAYTGPEGRVESLGQGGSLGLEQCPGQVRGTCPKFLLPSSLFLGLR